MRICGITFMALCVSICMASSNNSSINDTATSTYTFDECNGKVTSPGTIITSENYPDQYPNDKICNIDVEFKDDELIELRFLDFDVPGKANRFNTGCSTYGDYLLLIDGYITLGQPFCKFHRPVLSSPIKSTGPFMTIRFRSKHNANENQGRGFKLKVEIHTPAKCFCQNENGNITNNGILCGKNGIFRRTQNCNPNAWCIGPFNESNAVIESPTMYTELCKDAKTSCGNEILAPSCRLCPKNNDTTFNSWCSEHCYYLEASDGGSCTEMYRKLSVKSYDGGSKCNNYGSSFNTLSTAKSACSSDEKCLGIADSFQGIYLCNGIDVLESNCVYKCYDVYKKDTIPVSSKNFVRFEMGVRCKYRNRKILEYFSFDNGISPNASLALHECEEYCSLNKICWGCSIAENRISNQFNALEECGNHEQWNGLINGDISEKMACFEVKLTTGKTYGIGWTLGSCSGIQHYQTNHQYTERCCLRPGTYILTCFSTQSLDGWNNGYIEFQEQRYCDDFVGREAMRSVQIAARTENELSGLVNNSLTASIPDPNKIPRRPVGPTGIPLSCPLGTVDCHEKSYCPYCFCEDHCSWEICRLQVPRKECLETTNSSWIWNSRLSYYVAQKTDMPFEDEQHASRNRRLSSANLTVQSTKTISPETSETMVNKEDEENNKSIKRELLFWALIASCICLIIYLLNDPKIIAKDPKVIFQRLRLILKFLCFFVVCYMTLHLLERYLENRDATVSMFKRYNEKQLNNYPTFSFCFRGTRMHWFHNYNIYKVYELNATQYELLLKGEIARKYHFNSTSKLYAKFEVNKKKIETKLFSQFHLQLSDVLNGAKFATEYSKHDKDWVGKDDLMTKDPPMEISLQDPDRICFTRKSYDTLKLIRTYDKMSFNRSVFAQYPSTVLDIFVHHPGQLLKGLDNPSRTLYLQDTELASLDIDSNSMLEFRLSQQILLKKRPESNEACNIKIKDYDLHLIEKMVQQIKCVPIYWKRWFSANATEFPDCLSRANLKKASEIIQRYKDVIEANEKPCVDMFVANSYSWIKLPKYSREYPNYEKESIIRFVYTDRYYQEIEYVKDFGFESFWSGVGGFVGIFLGYSMRQLPELFVFISKSLQKLKTYVYKIIC